MFVFIYNDKIMTQLTICSSCNKHYDSVINEKNKTYYKTCNDCRHARKQRIRRKSHPQTKINEDNIPTKSSTQHSQSSISNTLETITNNINSIQFLNIGNDNTDETFEHRKPTINEILNHINISLD